MAVFALLASFFGVLGLDFAARATTTERIVVNRYSGLAIGGFDPVAYFTDSMPISKPRQPLAANIASSSSSCAM